jgi:hypothetical protein
MHVRPPGTAANARYPERVSGRRGNWWETPSHDRQPIEERSSGHQPSMFQQPAGKEANVRAAEAMAQAEWSIEKRLAFRPPSQVERMAG